MSKNKIIIYLLAALMVGVCISTLICFYTELTMNEIMHIIISNIKDSFIFNEKVILDDPSTNSDAEKITSVSTNTESAKSNSAYMLETVVKVGTLFILGYSIYKLFWP